LKDDFKVLVQRFSQFEQTLEKVDNSLEEVKIETEQIKSHIDLKKKLLLQMIEQMTNQMFEEVDSVQKEKIKLLENQKKSLEILTNRTKSSLKSIEEGEKLDNIVASVNIKENIEKIKFKSIQKEPSATTGFNKFLDITEQIISLQNMKLKSILDVKNCFIEGKSFSSKVDQYLTFVIKPVSKLGNIINLDVNPFQVSLLSSPEHAKVKIENSKVDSTLGIYFRVTSDTPGKYIIRVQSCKIDVKDSPLTIIFEETNSMSIDLTIGCWYGATFNEFKQEFWIKASYASKVIHRFDKKGVNVGEIELPYEVSYLSTDKEGNVFIGNGLNQFLMLDSSLNPVWIIEHEESKQAFPICCSNDVEDADFCFAIYRHKILVLDKEDGSVRKIIKPNYQLDDPSSIILFNHEIWISDLFNVKIFDKNGNFQRMLDIEACSLILVNDKVFYCPFNSTNWKRAD
jgi:hypothetical protein